MSRQPRARRARDERGISAVVVVVSLTALFGAAMLSVDAGSVWTMRRSLIAHTDAAALAAARYIDAGGAAACSDASGAGIDSAAAAEARELLTADDANATLHELTVSPAGGDCSSGAGHVLVRASQRASLAFAGLFGLGEVHPSSASIAQYGPLARATGLRPIAICDKSEHFREWRNHLNGGGPWPGPNDRVGPGGAVIHRLYFQKGASGCGSAAGNWDWLDFNDETSPSGSDALRQWLIDGYGGNVSLGDLATGMARDCNPEHNGNQPGCGPKTGATSNASLESLRYLRDNQVAFPIVVYDRVVDRRDPQGCDTPPPWRGDGANARFCPVAFLMVRLHGWDKITGQTGDDSYFDFEFLDEWWVGQVGRDPGQGRPSVHGVQLCGTEYGGTTDDHCDV